MSQDESLNQTEEPSTGAWPVLRASRAEPCDGTDPGTGSPCVLGYHHGYHRDAAGAEWLDP